MEINPETVTACDQCFGCGKNNPCGLKMEFEWDGKIAKSEFTPVEMHQGWHNIIHGGILTALLDEAMAYAACFERIGGVTAAIEVRFRKPVSVGQHLTITSWVGKRTRRFVETEGAITLDDGTVVTEAKAKQFVSAEVNIYKESGEMITPNVKEV